MKRYLGTRKSKNFPHFVLYVLLIREKTEDQPNNEKTKTILHYSKIANFEALRWKFLSSSINLFFVKSVYILKVP